MENEQDKGAAEMEQNPATVQHALPDEICGVMDADLFQYLFDFSPDALLVVASNGTILHVNRRTETIFGYARAELVGQAIEILVPAQHRKVHQHHRVQFDSNPQMRPMGIGLNLCGERKDGSQFPVDIMLSPGSHGRSMAVLVVARDISEKKTIQEALKEVQERSLVTLNSIGDAVLSTDQSGKVTYLNKAAENMTGWNYAEALLRPLAEVFVVLEGDSRERIADPMAIAMCTNAPCTLPNNSILVRRDGVEIPIEDSVAPIHDGKGQIVGAVIIFRDVSQLRELSSQMAYMAQHDVLTDLPNRMLLDAKIVQAIDLAARHKSRLAVLFLDLDHFKLINDSLGHAIGDQLLQFISSQLKACVRGADTVSRTGGDEFVILLSEVAHAEDAAISARKILAALSTPAVIAGNELQVTVSIGISIYPDNGTDAGTLIKNADMAMYQAKDGGRNNYHFFTG